MDMKLEPARLDFSAVAKGRTSVPGPIIVTAPDRKILLADLERRLVAGQGFSLATLNLDHLVKLGRDSRFHAAYAAQTDITADGNPIVWLCAMAGQRVALIPGCELVEPMAALAAKAGFPVAMVGSTEGSLKSAAETLTARWPGLQVIAQIAPSMGFNPDGPEADKVIAELRVSGARICFLALGAPKQEIFAARAHAALPEVGFLSIGAGLDFLSGVQTRAPALMRMLALEWLWRLATNPRRLFARYASCLLILRPAIRAARTARRDSATRPETP